jgi:hypothetical protein
VALAAVESLHLTEPAQAGLVSPTAEATAWRQLVEAEKRQLAIVQALVGSGEGESDGSGGGADNVEACASQLVAQICSLLEPPTQICIRDVLVLSLRMCSLAGPIFGERGIIDGTPRAMRPLQRALRTALLASCR